MKIVTILGSPKKNGNTAKLLDMFEEIVTPEHKIDRIDIVSYNINGCRGCAACKIVIDEPGCILKDDADALLERIISADVVVYASPLYCWGVTSQLKALIDRHYCLIKKLESGEFKSLVENKPIALLVTAGGPIRENADLVQEMFSRLGGYSRCDVVGSFILPFCLTPDKIGVNGLSLAQDLAEAILKRE